MVAGYSSLCGFHTRELAFFEPEPFLPGQLIALRRKMEHKDNLTCGNSWPGNNFQDLVRLDVSAGPVQHGSCIILCLRSGLQVFVQQVSASAVSLQGWGGAIFIKGLASFFRGQSGCTAFVRLLINLAVRT